MRHLRTSDRLRRQRVRKKLRREARGAVRRPLPLAGPRGRPPRCIPPGWISAKDLSKRLNVSTTWVYRRLAHLAVRLDARDYQWRVSAVELHLGLLIVNQ